MEAVAAKSNTNFIQRNLIPEDSCNVRYVMQQAAYYGSSDTLVVAHFVSIAFAVVAVAMSALNTISYLLQAPIKILLNVVQFNPFGLVADFFLDVGDVARSALFVCLGLTLVVAGFLFPKPIFTHFSPEYYEPLEVRLEQQLEKANERIQDLEDQCNQMKEQCGNWRKVQLDYERQIEELRKQAGSSGFTLNPLRLFRRG